MAQSHIQWTGQTWNFITGCSKQSAGCKNCYAMRMAWRLQHIPMMRGKYAGTAEKTAGGAINWTGKVNFDADALLMPLKLKKPQLIFVNSMSDLFHPGVPDEVVDRALCIMRSASQHTFQILTKQPERMEAYFNAPFRPEILDALYLQMMNEGIALRSAPTIIQKDKLSNWPLRNVWLGVSIEDQKAADKRIPFLLRTIAAVRFLSCEPLLGPINFTLSNIPIWDEDLKYNVLTGEFWARPNDDEFSGYKGAHIDWVIVGGESGSGARPMHPDWARILQIQCAAAGVPFFFKQWGSWMPIDMPWAYRGSPPELAKNEEYLNFTGESGFHGVQVYRMRRVARTVSGRHLDGVEYNEMPTCKDPVW